MTIMLIVIAMVLFIGASALLAIPKPVRQLARQNCYDLQGEFHPRRYRIERAAFLNVIADMSVITILLFVLIGGAILLIDQELAPTSLIADAFREFDLDEETWARRLKGRPEGDLGKAYKDWAGQHGMSAESAQLRQHLLWRTWPIFLVAGLIAIFSANWIYGNTSVGSIAQYINGVCARSRNYVRRDLRTMEAEVIRNPEPAETSTSHPAH